MSIAHNPALVILVDVRLQLVIVDHSAHVYRAWLGLLFVSRDIRAAMSNKAWSLSLFLSSVIRLPMRRKDATQH